MFYILPFVLKINQKLWAYKTLSFTAFYRYKNTVVLYIFSFVLNVSMFDDCSMPSDKEN